jgi:RNA recognition motif-containing protein
MNTEEGAKAAIEALNGKDWKGRSLTVNEARPREDRGGGGGSSSRGYGNQSRPRY